MEHIKPYEGQEPYIFISYAHRDAAAVMEIVEDMQSRGYRIWYDEGIELGSEWPECIAEHLRDAHLVLAFISNAYTHSDNCRREMHYSLSKKKKIVNIFLENTEMTPGMEMQIGSIFALMRFNMSEAGFYEKLYTAPLLNSEAFANAQRSSPAPASGEKRNQGDLMRMKEELELRRQTIEVEKAERRLRRRKRRRVRLAVLGGILALLLIAAGVLGIIAYFSGYLERFAAKPVTVTELSEDTPAVFSQALFEEAAREFTGVYDRELRVSELKGITQLYIAGESVGFSEEAVFGTDTAPGRLTELSDLKYFTGLKRLYLGDQPLSSLESLPPSNLEELYLSDCPLGSLEGISRLPKLRELSAPGCPICDLGDIGLCLNIRTLCLPGSDISDFSGLKPLVKLKEFSAAHCDMAELRTVLHISGLSSISLYDCDLRGSFFKAFDKERRIVSMELRDCRLDSTDNLNDFSGLTELCLVNTGGALDWSELMELPALKTVRVSEELYEEMTVLFKDTAVMVEMAE